MRLPPWALALTIVVAAGYAVPYLLLPSTERWTGAFLFWLAFGAIVWVLLIAVVMSWNTESSRNLPRGAKH